MFATPLGLLALLAIPAIVGLHLFRRRFQPRTVSAVFLWLDADRTPLAGRKKERLHGSWSLWAELAAAACLALALAGMRGCSDRPAEHLVAVLDASASMGARASTGTSAERASKELLRRIDELPRGSRVTLVVSGAHPTLLAGPAAFPEEARARLTAADGYAPRARRHDLTTAVAFALQVSGGARVAVFTDHFEPDRFPPEVELVALGEPLPNIGFVDARRTRTRVDAGGEKRVEERVSVTMVNASDRPARTTMTITPAGALETALIEPRAVEFAPRERKSLSFLLPAATPPVVVAVTHDALSIDDQVYLAPPAPRTLSVATTLDDAAARMLGLAGPVSKVEHLLAIVDECVEASNAADAHLVIGARPAGGPASWCLTIESRSDAAAGERKDFIGPFLFEKRHPLLDGLTLEGIVWSADASLALPGVPLVAAGNLPLLVDDDSASSGPAASGRVFRLNLDPARSSLARSPDWPILLSNLCELRRRSLPGVERANLAVGDDLTYRAGAGFDPERGDITFEAEDGSVETRRIPARSTAVIGEVDRPGVFRLRQADTTLARVGISFQDAAESDLTGAATGTRPAQAASATVAAGASWVETMLLVLAIGAILFDWLVVRRSSAFSVAGGKEEADGLPAP